MWMPDPVMFRDPMPGYDCHDEAQDQLGLL
jgi:hypothetical protein